METVPIGAVIDSLTIFFVLTTMLSMGLELTLEEIRASLEQRRLLARALVANLVLVPLLAFGLVLAVPMRTEYAIGLLLIAIAPGAPFGPKLAELSRSDLAFASGLMAILGIVSVISIPLSVSVLMPAGVAVDPVAIAEMVIVAQLVPLLLGLGVNARSAGLATRLYPPVQRLSTLSLLLLIALLVVINGEELLGLVGTGTLFVSIVVVGSSLLLGYAFGGPARTTREVLATTTAARNAAIALLIATASFSNPSVLTMIVAFSLISLVMSVLLAGEWR
ncbi:bile acid:sodium symporter family protein [Natrialba sp. SSL1]|uniref:bile acid:sodium symporter family protein n=1 Tax=Natrialba sp. SSL1 TaxID=1869245 RepID=UPI0008F7F03D|nr:bile acid:sodium symporter [Natrialba sp. SSL1]OIB58637.1 sodium symporter [Natrialba sp. SSL1]